MAVDTEQNTRKLVTLPHDLVRAVEDYRFANRIKTESEALRLLIRAGLDALTPPSPTKKPSDSPSVRQAPPAASSRLPG